MEGAAILKVKQIAERITSFSAIRRKFRRIASKMLPKMTV